MQFSGVTVLNCAVSRGQSFVRCGMWSLMPTPISNCPAAALRKVGVSASAALVTKHGKTSQTMAWRLARIGFIVPTVVTHCQTSQTNRANLLVANRWNAAVVTGPAASGCKYWTHCAWRSADNRTPTTAETLVQKFDRWNKRRQLGGEPHPHAGGRVTTSK